MAHNQYCGSCKHGLVFFLLALFFQRLHTITSAPSAAGWQPMRCDAAVSMNLPSCNSFLYATSEGRKLSEIAAVFNANASTTLLRQIKRPSGTVDVLVAVPCACEVINSTMSAAALFHDTPYVVKTGDTPDSVNGRIFSGLATVNFGDGLPLISGRTLTVHLPCGCSSKGVVVSYAVQDGDTLHNIASLFRTAPQDILKLNPSLANPEFLKPGWILFVPIGSS